MIICVCRLCAARGSKCEKQDAEQSALAERRASNGAASSSQSSSTKGFSPMTANPAKTQPHSNPCDGVMPNAFHGQHTTQKLNELRSQRSHRGTTDTCPSNIPSDINLPEQVGVLVFVPWHCSWLEVMTNDPHSCRTQHTFQGLKIDLSSKICGLLAVFNYSFHVDYNHYFLYGRYLESRYLLGAHTTGQRSWTSLHMRPAASWTPHPTTL